MWNSRGRTREDLATERARREELTRRVDAQQTTITFLCARINQIETERALLLRQLTNIDFPVPTVQVTPSASRASSGAAVESAQAAALEQISALGIFEDNPAHAPAGWHPDGSVNYGSLRDPLGPTPVNGTGA